MAFITGPYRMRENRTVCDSPPISPRNSGSPGPSRPGSHGSSVSFIVPGSPRILAHAQHQRIFQLQVQPIRQDDSNSISTKMSPPSSPTDPNTPEFLAWRRLQLSKAKLAGITEMATLMAGFSVVSTVELQINDDADPYLLSAFTIVTALLVCTTMLAIMISTCLLPYIQAVAKMSSPASESPHERMAVFIDLSWVLANTCSIFLFTLDVILLCWIKFTYFSVAASWCATAIMIPVLIAICAIAIIFYRKFVSQQVDISNRKFRELEVLMDHHIRFAESIRHV